MSAFGQIFSHTQNLGLKSQVKASAINQHPFKQITITLLVYIPGLRNQLKKHL
jgi:predicted ATPase